MEWILERVRSLSKLWLMNKGVRKMTESDSFLWQLCSTSGDGSGCELGMCHVFFTSFLHCVKRNKDRPGARQLRYSGLGSTAISFWGTTSTVCVWKYSRMSTRVKNKCEAITQALHIQSVPGHLVSILPSDLWGCIWKERSGFQDMAGEDRKAQYCDASAGVEVRAGRQERIAVPVRCRTANGDSPQWGHDGSGMVCYVSRTTKKKKKYFLA